MPPTLWAATLDQYKVRLSSAIYIAVFDDDGDGEADAASATEYLLDAQAKVEGALRGNYTFPLDPVPRLVTKLVLDFAQVDAARRHPEIARITPEKLESSANADLMMLRKNVIRLDDGSDGTQVEPTPQNSGCELLTGTDSSDKGVGTGWLKNGWGDF